MASVKINHDLRPAELQPTDLYGYSGNVELRIATGGAGQSGLLKALALAFIEDLPLLFKPSQIGFVPDTTSRVSQTGCEPFRIAWLASDTSLTFNSLAQFSSDIGITYHAYAERVAIGQGVVDRVEYAWRDHFVLVGPRENPANLPTDGKTSIHELFAKLFSAAIETASSTAPVRFLSRYDKSANNIAESRIWTTIGQTPWATPYSTFYHRYLDFPFGALAAASKLGEYTLVDRGTWHSIDREVIDRMVLFKEAFEAAEDDPLINPAHILVGKHAPNRHLANQFVDWMIKEDGGQVVIRKFAVNGAVLYSRAPKGVNPMNRVELLL